MPSNRQTKSKINGVALGIEHQLFAAADKGMSYTDIPGSCKASMIQIIREHGYALMPGRYAGAKEEEEDKVPFEEKMAILVD